jgi:cation diffusion facilitator family transporter
VASDESLLSVLVALAANVMIAIAKGVAAALTGSAALFAETLHTVADTGNEILLWIAVRRSGRPADPTHPLGYGPERYYWALLAAIGMFIVGGAVSIVEGIRALIDPPPLDAFWVGVAVLIIALALDGSSRMVAIRTLRRQAARVGVPMRTLIRESPDPTVTTIYFEDTIDVLGAALALIALILHRTLGWEWPDAVASLLIGCMLAFIAWKLSGRNLALISNEAVAPRLASKLRDALAAEDGIAEVRRMESIYLGPREALVAADVVVDCNDIPATLDRVRTTIKERIPSVTRLYLTPVANLAATRGGMLRDLYAAYNARDEGALSARLAPGVVWPGGMDAQLDPGAITERDDGSVAVEVHQGDHQLVHVFTFADDGLISRMDIEAAG